MVCATRGFATVDTQGVGSDAVKGSHFVENCAAGGRLYLWAWFLDGNNGSKAKLVDASHGTCQSEREHSLPFCISSVRLQLISPSLSMHA